jgi:glutathione S-transferase
VAAARRPAVARDDPIQPLTNLPDARQEDNLRLLIRAMHKLTHYWLCPHSRSIRIALAELGIEVELTEERPWEWRPELLALNPAGSLPVLQIESGPILCGSYAVSEYLSEETALRPLDAAPLTLFPGTRGERAEVRRLVDWFHSKLDREVTRELLHERLYARLAGAGSHGPDLAVLRAARANLRYHMSYIAFLADQRGWLAGDELSFADMAAAAHLSTLDYLGEVPWEDWPMAKTWYVRIKSRRAFRSLLADRVPGLAPPAHYPDLDF